MNGKQKGNITEIQTMLAISKLGYTVSMPYGDNESYDIIADIGGRLIKIQCKTARPKRDDKGSYEFNCRHVNNTHYTKDEIDYFATIIEDKCYLVPLEECKTSKSLRVTPAINNQEDGVNWASEYELEKVIAEIERRNNE